MTMKNIFFAFAGLILLSFGPVSKIKTPESFVFIPSSTTTIFNEKVSIQAFYMAEKEVSNFEYRQFLNQLKKEKNDSLIAIATPDTANWNMNGMYMQPFVEYYFSHPAYDNYPVVNVSKVGAELYCQWLTKELRSKYGNHLNDVRLPTKYEWASAAQGGNENAIYSWGNTHMKNSKGCNYANYLQIGDQNVKRTQNGFEIVQDSTFNYNGIEYTLTAPTESFWPNSFGLYNMCGNVAEMTNENTALGGHWNSPGYDIRITSEISADEASPLIGFRPIMTYMSLKN
jgi:formylglycine-generating enzyme required for sulfatase activity